MDNDMDMDMKKDMYIDKSMDYRLFQAHLVTANLQIAQFTAILEWEMFRTLEGLV